MLKRLGLAGLFLAAISGVSAANGPPGGRHRAPPPEAFEACAGKAAGDACTVTLPDRTVDGTCAAPPPGAGEGALACRPDHPPGGPPPGGPPPEAIDACSSKAAGEPCTVTLHEHTIDGTCRQGPDGNGPLACAPSGPPPERE